MVWVAVVLGVVVGVGVGVDAVARNEAERRITAQLEVAVPGLENPDVEVRGFPFVTQLMAGEIGAVRVHAAAITMDGLRLEDVNGRLLGVSTSTHTARLVDLEALASVETVEQALGIGLDLAVRDGQLVAATTLFGLPLDIVLEARVEAATVSIAAVGLTLAGATVTFSELPGSLATELQGLSFGVTGLPAGLELTGVVVVDTGLLLTALGTDVVLG